MALTDEELIYNEALGYIGEYQVEEGVTDSKQYELCSRFYAKSRDMSLASHPWKEATKSVIIIQDTTDPIFGYDRRYSKPSDTLRVLSVDNSIGADVLLNQQGVQAWEVEGDYILSNSGESPPTWATATEYLDGQFVSVTPDAWVTSTSYIDGQYVKSGNTVYEVLADHTSDTISNDVTAGNIISRGTGSTVSYEVLVTHTSDTVVNDITSGNISVSGDKVDARIVYVKYVWQLTTISKFSTHLREAIGIQLASKVIIGLTNDTKGKVDLINEFERITSPKARSIDGSQRKPKPIFNSEWIRSRTAGTHSWP